MRKTNGENAITLVALVLTIIILLILAGISISALTNTGIFGKAQEAKDKTEEAEKNQQAILDEYEVAFNENTTVKLTSDKMNKVLSTEKNVNLEDENKNKFTVPAGFKIVVDDTTNNVTTVDKGIVVEDATLNEDGTKTSTNGSQFVWVSVGNIKKSDGTTVEINLNRYIVMKNGTPMPQDNKAIIVEDYNYQEIETTTSYNNVIAKSISNFKASVEKNGGYYIGRYEARKNIDGKLTEIGTDAVWNNITQSEAATKSQNMYSETYTVTSDLINSYAWDTAMVFAQSFGQNGYSVQTSVNDTLANKGTNDADYIGTIDKQCNIYDMASNVREWSTEIYSNFNSSCTFRGGFYSYLSSYTSTHYHESTSSSTSNTGFRPILYF